MVGVDGVRPNDTPMTQEPTKRTEKWRRLEERQRGQRGRGEEPGDKGYHVLYRNNCAVAALFFRAPDGIELN
jgi:hypothetical protein